MEIFTSRLLSSENLCKRLNKQITHFKLETYKCAASVMLSALLEHYRFNERAQDNYFFNLVLYSNFKEKWNKLFPESTITCEKIINNPWSILTISDMTSQRGTEKEEDFVRYYRLLLIGINNSYDSQRILFPTVRVTSVHQIKTEKERLYCIVNQMNNILNHMPHKVNN